LTNKSVHGIIVLPDSERQKNNPGAARVEVKGNWGWRKFESFLGRPKESYR